MLVLNDDDLLIIFKMVNLNDRLNLRLTNRRFKILIDKIQNYKKLIIYQEDFPSPGQLYNNERYGYEDTVIVSSSLNNFFENKYISKCLKNLEVLVINGNRKKQNGFEIAFDKLIYLELNKIEIENLKMIKSTKIEYYVSYKAYCSSDIKMRKLYGIESGSFQNFTFKHIQSRNIKYLKIRDLTNLNFYILCVQNKVFNSLVQLDAILDEISPIIYLSENCPTLKTINCSIVEVSSSSSTLVFSFEKVLDLDLHKLVKELGENLSVYLFGILIKESNLIHFKEFINEIHLYFRILECNFSFDFNKYSCEILKKYEKILDLTGSYKLIEFILIMDDNLIRNNNLMKKLTNIEGIILLDVPKWVGTEKLKNLFKISKNISYISFECHYLVDYDVKFFDYFSKLSCLSDLHIVYFSRIDNFDFLFSSPRLAFSSLYLYFPFDQSMFIELIRKLKFLKYFEVCSIKPEKCTKEQLREFKERVEFCLKQEMKKKNYSFKIEIHSKLNSKTFLRFFFFKNSYYQDNLHGLGFEEYKTTIFESITRKHAILGHS